MTVNAGEKIQTNTSPFQSWVFRFVAVIALALIIIPILPMLVSNLAYSFSGEKPKIYWYLSRSSGFVTLTILWAAMAMGLGITNKMARMWPGAPTAFSVHQYTSLLGLFFAAYHGLVLMGDHYTDFSLPRLITPFSIDYKTVWVGLGQTSFYLWMLVVLSFYVRQFIGQKTWRVIHYANFATYTMGFLHGAFSGTDSNAYWARGYFWVSGVCILLLLAYRIYESGLKSKLSLPKFGFNRNQGPEETSPAITPGPARTASLPQALLREQALKPAPSLSSPVSTPASAPAPAPAPASQHPEKHPVPVMRPTVITAMEETPTRPIEKEKLESPPAKQKPAVSAVASAPKETEPPLKVKAKPFSPIESIHDDSNGNKIRVRIFKEPTTMPIPEFQTNAEEVDGELRALFIRVKQSFRAIPVEPPSPKRRAQKIVFSND